MFVSFAWLGQHDSEAAFDCEAPFSFLGEQLQSFGFAGRYVIIFLGGYEKLSLKYRSLLKRCGFEIVDFAAETRQLALQFPELERFDRYGFFCFLRWVALRRFLELEQLLGEQVIHLDGDIVFNASPDEIALDLEARTFVLQGCPAIASIADGAWFAQYEEALRQFSDDVDGYSAGAFADKDGWLNSARTKWAGVWEGPAMTHDQDLICYLIHADKLTQDRPAKFARSRKLYYAQNPFWLHEGAELQLGRETDLFFSVRDNVCYLEEKKIAVWHFQRFFARQLALVLRMHARGFADRYPDGSRLETVQPAVDAKPLTRKELHRAIRELDSSTDKAAFSFADYYNRERFWKPGVFSNPQPS